MVHTAPQEAGHYGDVVSAEAGGLYLDDYVVWAGFGGYDIADLELRRRAGLLDEEGFQSASPRAGLGRCSAVTLIVSARLRSLSIDSGTLVGEGGGCQQAVDPRRLPGGSGV